MGDTDAPATENQSESTENVTCDVSKSSVNELSRSKPNENIAISEVNKEVDGLSITAPTIDNTLQSDGKINKTEGDVAAENADVEKDDTVSKDKINLKNKSDIFTFDNTKDLPSTIFSVGGAPSKTIRKSAFLNKMSLNGGVEGGNQFRNPLTGIGVSSNDEFKSKPSKRRDGNPLLGVGYKDDDFFSSHTNQKIPPGGYSKGLW